MVRVIDVRRSGDRYRGSEPPSGISSLHAFSFGGHYDPDNLRFGPLLACNEERLAPGAGFDEHPHSHTEIVTWVTEGELTHQDSTGRTTVVRPGDVQHLSAASGVRHVERNDGPAPLTFLQMWLAPLTCDGAPAYSLIRREDLPQDHPDTVVLTLPAAAATLHHLQFTPGRPQPLPEAPLRYVHVLNGEVRVGPAPAEARSGASAAELGPGDSARIGGPAEAPLTLMARGKTSAELLVWAMEW
ncbi:pirin family protein [Streptomyces albidoflavus]|uniref:pirin family protein n=1 Tax=Streptomyces sp. 604F TaxID=1476754 RepID=UPI0013991FEA|nr:pirin family protein [Streptomyces sp. 604F]MBP3080032.1 pirin [Streptomyces sp. 604F]QHV84963.1 pirin family protein [Streptomyces sp. 604F]